MIRVLCRSDLLCYILKIIYDSFGSSVHRLARHDSNTNIEVLASANHTKRGPKRKFSPEQEFFLVLVCLRVGFLQ